MRIFDIFFGLGQPSLVLVIFITIPSYCPLPPSEPKILRYSYHILSAHPVYFEWQYVLLNPKSAGQIRANFISIQESQETLEEPPFYLLHNFCFLFFCFSLYRILLHVLVYNGSTDAGQSP